MTELALRAKQSLFARLLADLIVWITNQDGWEVTLADVGVRQMRRVQYDGRLVTALDREHMKGSLHYQRLAADLNLFVRGEWITDGDHLAWRAIGMRWEGQHQLCRWGGRFTGNPDANHVSLEHEGRA